MINETPPNGQEFSKAVKHILKREEQWNAWKNDGCPALNKDFSKSSEMNHTDVAKDSEGTKGKTYICDSRGLLSPISLVEDDFYIN